MVIPAAPRASRRRTLPTSRSSSIRWNVAATVTSSTGTVVAIRGSIHFVFDASNGTFAFDGQVFMANRPGAGVVIQDTGKYLVGPDDQVLLDAGPHDVEDIGPSIFCSALL